MEELPLSSSSSSKMSMDTKKKIAVVSVFGVILLLSLISIIIFGFVLADGGANAETPSSPPPSGTTEKFNMIYMITDGCGPSSFTFARNMNPDKTPLPIDEMFIGVVNTYSSQNLVTDSAAGATTYACGQKTYNEAIAVDDNYKILGTSMEAAKRLGYLTGLVVTSRVTHATPAAFTSHVTNRDFEEDIALQQAKNQSIDLLFGGGLDEYTKREDGQDLLSYMRNERGYQTIFNLTQLENEDLKLPIIGLFAESHMDFEIDRVNENPLTQPALPQMVKKALELISSKAKEEDKGFFILIEGSRIDMAAHNNDAYAHYLELQQYMLAIEEVKKFVDENPNTYVISTSDHSTGGMTLGRRSDDGSYPIYDWYPDQLRQQNKSVEEMKDIIEADPTNQTIADTFLTYANYTVSQEEIDEVLWSLTTDEEATVKATIGNIISKRANIGWTTSGHTGEDVNLYSYGLRPEGLVGGVMDNTQVAMSYINQLGFYETMTQITQEMSDFVLPEPFPYGEEDQRKRSHKHIYGHN